MDEEYNEEYNEEYMKEVLDELTHNDLKTLADDWGISYTSKTSKSALVKKIVKPLNKKEQKNQLNNTKQKPGEVLIDFRKNHTDKTGNSKEQRNARNMSEERIKYMSEERRNTRNMSEERIKYMSEERRNTRNMSEERIKDMSEERIKDMSDKEYSDMLVETFGLEEEQPVVPRSIPSKQYSSQSVSPDSSLVEEWGMRDYTPDEKIKQMKQELRQSPKDVDLSDILANLSNK